MPGMGGMGHCAQAPTQCPLSPGAAQAPSLSTGCIFLPLHPSEKASKPREMCFWLCLVSDSQHVVSPAKLRHLLTYSVQLRPELYLSIRETIVTDNLPVAEKKLCILSHKSCLRLPLLPYTLLGLPAFFPGAQPVLLKRHPGSLPFWHRGPVFMFIYS